MRLYLSSLLPRPHTYWKCLLWRHKLIAKSDGYVWCARQGCYYYHTHWPASSQPSPGGQSPSEPGISEGDG